MRHKFWTGPLLTGALVAISLVGVEPARAFSWSEETNSFLVEDGMGTDKYIDVFFYDATINGTSVDGLTATARFSLAEAFDASTDKVKLKIELANTVDTNIWSSARLSGFAFGVDPNAIDADVEDGGLFDFAHVDKNYAEGVGLVDVCYSDNKNNCLGGKNGGLTLGQTGELYTTLYFDQTVDSFNITVNDVYARWQSLDSNHSGIYGDTYNDASGIGYGEVPTPALIPSVLGAGMAALRSKQKEVENEEEKQLVKS